jgi:nucleoside-diphosphate-sugar epimerase
MRPFTALVTGCAGFLGSHLCEALLSDGHTVVGVDRFSDYYSRTLKESHIAGIRRAPDFTLIEADLAEASLESLLDGVDVVFHLAAQPGVRPSFGPGFGAYLRDNVHATERLLEAAAGRDLAAFVYASSSSVYGDQDVYPAREDAPVRPISPYGSTEVITEQLAGAFWRAAGVPVVGLRYFTVYGPRQRPDMAFSRFPVVRARRSSSPRSRGWPPGAGVHLRRGCRASDGRRCRGWRAWIGVQRGRRTARGAARGHRAARGSPRSPARSRLPRVTSRRSATHRG